MLQFASPLPRNYHHIVRIFTEPVNDADEKVSPSTVRMVDPWLDSSLVVVKEVKERKAEVKELTEIKSEPVLQTQTSTIPTETTTSTDCKPIQDAPIPNVPFVVKPVIATLMNETQLSQANLDEKYMEQREQMLKTREDAKRDAMKEDIKTKEELKADIPQDFVNEQKRLFDDQQAALRALRLQTVVSEVKAKRDVEQPLPPPNVSEDEVKTTTKMTSRVLPPVVNDQKQLADIPQSLPSQSQVSQTTPIMQPVDSLPIDQLKVDKLKQLCMKRGLSTKGNKADLIARLRL